MRTGACHKVATRLVERVRDITSTRFVAPFTHVPSSHGNSNVRDHEIMSFGIIVKYIKSFTGADLLFTHDVIAVQIEVDIYLVP